jgi:hypothetical protein
VKGKKEIASIVYPTGKLVFIIVHLHTFLPANLQDLLLHVIRKLPDAL